MTKLGISDTEMARRVGKRLGRTVSNATVGRWRLGKQEPGFEDRDALAAELDVPVAHLYRDATDARTTAGLQVHEMWEMVGQVLPQPKTPKNG